MLLWDEKAGVGFYPCDSQGVYNEAYFDKYAKYDDTPLGEALLAFRTSLVQKYCPSGTVLDVGVGSGSFVDEMNAHRGYSAFGYDINPFAVSWLKMNDVYGSLESEYRAVTFWDSFEHILNQRPYLDAAVEWVFMSIPLFTSDLDVLVSKHFRTDEHYWYYSAKGIASAMRLRGFDLVERLDVETQLGRESIGTFVFKRNQENES